MNRSIGMEWPYEGMRVSPRVLYSTLLALVPVIMVLNVPLINIGASTVLLGLTAPYALLYHSNGKKRIHLLMLAIAFGYLLVRSTDSIMDIFLLLVVLIHAYGASKGALNIATVRKTIEAVAVFGAACIVLQTLLHYLLGSNTAILLIPEFVLADNQYYFAKETIEGMYRPSAFFLEPSHYTQYCSVALLSTLVPLGNGKAKLPKALWIALGCILTTSGMGIALCVGIFAWYALFTKRQKGAKLLYLLAWVLAAVVAFVVLMQFSFFALSVQRVFGDVNGYNAIWGRTLFWDMYIGSMRGSQVIFGNGAGNLPDIYMTGLMEVIYSYGYIGVGVLLLLFIYLFTKSKDLFSKCLCIVYPALMCVANLFGFILLSFWLSIIIASICHRQAMQ